MGKHLAVSIALCAAAIAAPALAQSGPSAHDMIAATSAPGDLTDVSTVTQQRVRHRASGVVCAFDTAVRAGILHYENGVLSCNTMAEAGYRLQIVQDSALADGPMAVDTANEAAVANILAGLGEGQLIERRKDSFRVGGAPTRMTILTGVLRGVFVRVVVRTTVVGEWVVVQTAAAPPEYAEDADWRAEQRLRDAVAGVPH